MYFRYRSIVLVGAVFVIGLATVFSQTVQRVPVPAGTPQENPPIQLFVTVSSKKGFVPGLSQESFKITVDKAPAKIVRFSNEDSPVSVGILVDASGWMRKLGTDKGKKLRILQEGLAWFTSRSNSANAYFLIGFNERPQLLTDWTSKAPLIPEDMLSLKPFGNTALYDACFLGINKLQNARHPRRALILISDGQDNHSRYSYYDLRKLLKETGTLIYAIFLSDSEPGTSLGMEGQGILAELSDPSGGWFATLAFKPREAIDIFESIANELRTQYTIAIEPPSSADEKKWHKIKLKVTAQNPAGEMKSLSARTREGFYAPQNPIKIP